MSVKLTNSIDENRGLKLETSWAGQEILHLLKNRNSEFRVEKSSPLDSPF
jgi:hypothetical protein